MRHLHTIRAALGLALLAAPAAALAQTEASCATDPNRCTHFAAIFENDKPSGNDQNYTNGFLIAWSSRAFQPPSWAAPYTERARGLLLDENLRWGLSFGQNIYTPRDTMARNPDLADRPYAGWLYGALTLISSGPTQLSSLELQLGVVGPSALGEFVQNGFHDIINTQRSHGWDYQIKDEPGANLVFTHQRRLNTPTFIPGVSVGVLPSLSASLGNVNTYLGGGAMFRIGNALESDFGPPRIRPVSAGSVFYETPTEGFGWYLFAGVEGRVVARDISLDGNTFRESRNVEREWFVGDASAGLALMLGEWRLTGTYTIRSREFEEQREPSQYGSLSIARRF